MAEWGIGTRSVALENMTSLNYNGVPLFLLLEGEEVVVLLDRTGTLGAVGVVVSDEVYLGGVGMLGTMIQVIMATTHRARDGTVPLTKVQEMLMN